MNYKLNPFLNEQDIDFNFEINISNCIQYVIVSQAIKYNENISTKGEQLGISVTVFIDICNMIAQQGLRYHKL
jgi:hypothetical protein